VSLETSIKLAVESLGAKLYDIVIIKENNRNIFRVVVTSPNGINLDKCAEISRMISPILDVEEPMSGVYNLEVSSPGIERKLKKKEHFMGSIGELVKIKNTNTEIFKGKLLKANEDKIVLLTKLEEVEFTYDDILSASTYFEW